MSDLQIDWCSCGRCVWRCASAKEMDKKSLVFNQDYITPKT